jgi:hypothetical protein
MSATIFPPKPKATNGTKGKAAKPDRAEGKSSSVSPSSTRKRRPPGWRSKPVRRAIGSAVMSCRATGCSTARSTRFSKSVRTPMMVHWNTSRLIRMMRLIRMIR